MPGQFHAGRYSQLASERSPRQERPGNIRLLADPPSIAQLRRDRLLRCSRPRSPARRGAPTPSSTDCTRSRFEVSSPMPSHSPGGTAVPARDSPSRTAPARNEAALDRQADRRPRTQRGPGTRQALRPFSAEADVIDATIEHHR